MDEPEDKHQDSGDSVADVVPVAENLPEGAQFEEPVDPSDVAGEEDASEGEPVDIDAQLDSIGHKRDHD